MTSTTIFVLNGPNLNLLGTREPEIYGTDTLDDIAGRLEDQARALGMTIDMRQSNHEGHLIDWLHEANAVGAKAVLLNAGGLTHTSIAIHDAIKSIKCRSSKSICPTRTSAKPSAISAMLAWQRWPVLRGTVRTVTRWRWTRRPSSDICSG